MQEDTNSAVDTAFDRELVPTLPLVVEYAFPPGEVDVAPLPLLLEDTDGVEGLAIEIVELKKLVAAKDLIVRCWASDVKVQSMR